MSLVLVLMESCLRPGLSAKPSVGATVLRSVRQLAEPQERADLLSAVYVVSYLAFSVPALVAGVLATHIGLLNTSLAYGGFVALRAVGALTLERLSDR